MSHALDALFDIACNASDNHTYIKAEDFTPDQLGDMPDWFDGDGVYWNNELVYERHQDYFSHDGKVWMIE